MSFAKCKMKLVLVVQRIHKKLTEKKWKIQILYSEFDCLTGFSVLFLVGVFKENPDSYSG